jgi:hypothetical protein
MIPETKYSEIGLEIVTEAPRMRFEVEVGILSSNKAPSPWLYILWRVEEEQYAVL